MGKSNLKRDLGDAANPATLIFPGWSVHGINNKHDIRAFAEEDIIGVLAGTLKRFRGGVERVDFRKLKLLPGRPGYKGSTTPPG